MHVFYLAQPLEGSLTLSEEESKHCVQVLRLGIGDELQVINGKGSIALAQIISAHPKRCELSILSTSLKKQADFILHLACAPTKNIDRYEWMLEKSTEIGIEKITPLICEHSERSIVKLERLQKVVVSALKQSLGAYLPILEEAVSFDTFIKSSANFNGQKFIAHCYPSDKKSLKQSYTKGKNALLLIGPEGDFSKTEVEVAIANGFVPVSLSEKRLRTETAGIVGVHTIRLINEG